MFDREKFTEYVKLAGYTYQEIANKIGICRKTLYKKIQKDGNFKKQEMNRLCQILKIQNPEEIFFA